MEKVIRFNSKKELVLELAVCFLGVFILAFCVFGFIKIDIFLVRVEAVCSFMFCLVCTILGLKEFFIHRKNKIVINYNEEKISLFLKLKVRREKFFIDINLNFSEIEQIEIIEIENENFYDFKIITSTSEEYIALKSILKNWKIQRRERLAKEILIELETLAKAIKETKQI